MNKLNLIAIGAGLVMVAVAGAAGGQMRDKERAEAIETFRIAEADLPMMQTCENTLVTEKIQFKTKVSEISACGCVARNVNDRIDSNEREFAAGIFPTIAVAAVKGDEGGRHSGDFANLIVKHRITARRLDVVTTALMDAVSKCSSHDIYMSDDQKARNAADKAKRDANSRTVIEQLVAEGHMTREEANRRLSHM